MPRARTPLPKDVPRTLRFESVVFNVLTLGDGRLAFRYYEGSKPIVVKRQTIDELKAEAERIATAIINADTAALDMTADERRIYISARALLGTIAVDAGARILAEAGKLVGGIDRVVEACRWFGQSQRSVQEATTADVVAHFVRNLRSDGLDVDYVDPMEKDLEKFAAQFPGSFSLVTTKGIDGWLRDLTFTPKVGAPPQPIGLRRRRNLRAQIVTLFNFAVEQEYLPENIKTAAERVKRPKVPRKAPAIYSPEEVSLIIEQFHQPANRRIGRKDYVEFLPCVVIAAFAGLRWEEIMNLEWSKIHWEDQVIEVGEEEKTGYRMVPIQPNLMTWLAPYRDARTGFVCQWRKRRQVGNIVRRVSIRAGLKVGGRRYANAFRHSCLTYRVSVTKNFPLIAYESGNSVPELKKSYNRASLERVGLAYFAISNHTPDNVTQMPLLSFSGKK